MLKSLDGLLLCYGKHGMKPGKLETRNSKKKIDILPKMLACCADIKIIYHCQEHLPDERSSQLKLSIEEHLSQSNVLIDEWLLMFKSIIYKEVIKRNKKIWREDEKLF
jgi:hypothetical protein